MSDIPAPHSVPTPVPEVEGGRRSVPVWLFVLLFLLLYWGMVYFDQHSGWLAPEVYAPYRSITEVQMYQPRVEGFDVENGRRIYEQVAQCALCHNTDGTGKPAQAPPLAKSEWATGNPNRMIRIPLSGLTGPIQVNGQEWNLSMPAMGAGLSDDDLAAVLTYIRQSWGNKASEITPEQVKAVRSQVGGRSQPWTVGELSSIQ